MSCCTSVRDRAEESRGVVEKLIVQPNFEKSTCLFRLFRILPQTFEHRSNRAYAPGSGSPHHAESNRGNCGFPTESTKRRGEMDCLFALQSYINVLLLSTPESAKSNLEGQHSGTGTDGAPSSSSIKILLLDLKTTAILSLSTTQSNLLLHGVYLTDFISNPSRSTAVTPTNRARGNPASKLERLPHLHCITFLRPTEENIQLLERELNEARYGTYSLFFTGVLKRDWIERLAEADVAESVREVQVRRSPYQPLWSFRMIPGDIRLEYVADGICIFRNSTPISRP